MSFGERLKSVRLDRNLTQAIAAEALGVSINTISQYENGKRFPSERFIVHACNYYSVSADYLFGLSEKKRTNNYLDCEKKLSEKQKSTLDKIIEILIEDEK